MFRVRHVGKAGRDILESAANARRVDAGKLASPSRPTGSASNCTWFHLIPLNSTYFHFPALGGWPPPAITIRPPAPGPRRVLPNPQSAIRKSAITPDYFQLTTSTIRRNVSLLCAGRWAGQLSEAV